MYTYHFWKHLIPLNFQNVVYRVVIYVFHYHSIQVSEDDVNEKSSVKKKKKKKKFKIKFYIFFFYKNLKRMSHLVVKTKKKSF